MNQDTELRGFSIAGAYPYLIATGNKTIEIRNWEEKYYRGVVLLHCSSSKAYDGSFEEWGLTLEECPKSAIIGFATLVDCKAYNDKTWEEDFEKHCWEVPYSEAVEQYGGKQIYGHVFDNPYVLEEPLLGIKGTFRYWVAKDEAQIDAFEEVQLMLKELEVEG
ncbi:ASCH domain-containing protein [Calothrix sp. UHCC 0171]|uniref:ASCH domain-containing protein n=1 Tax=Calothrix sp. UHCC 0171 TaxID=3110245 RepID=UPI002B1EB25E|nr:ASCH domain-containing protein [Calothrix sp. UHCC 0171]MEA5573277.1 ASCH domain-containing protein [Calothrix sp. UHCC 0171]